MNLRFSRWLLWGGLALGAPVVGFAFTANQSGDFEAMLRLDDDLVGKLELKVTTKGAFTGVLRQSSGSKALKGKFIDAVGGPDTAVIAVAGVTKSQPLRLELLLAEDGVLACVLKNGNTQAVIGEGGGGKRRLPPAGVLAALKGPYNLVLLPDAKVSHFINGRGYASMTMDAAAGLSFTGTLTDGTKFTGRVLLDDELRARLYVSPYKSGGFLGGELQFEARSDGRYHVPKDQVERLVLKSPVLDALPQLLSEPVFRAWVEPWYYRKGTDINLALGWAPNQTMRIFLGDRFMANYDFQGIYAALPVTVQFTPALGLVSRDYFIEFSKNKWKATLNPATGVFTGSYITYATLTQGAKEKVLYTVTNSLSGVFMMPDPAENEAGVGMGLVVSPKTKNTPLYTTDLGFSPKP